jgi:hypothetical protein
MSPILDKSLRVNWGSRSPPTAVKYSRIISDATDLWVMVGTPDFYDQVSFNNQLEISTHRILRFPILSILFYILPEILCPDVTDNMYIMFFVAMPPPSS